MKSKRIAPAALNALKEALTYIYWYKSDLRSFLTQAVSDPAVLGRINWDDYKRNIAAALVDFLGNHEDIYQRDLLRLMTEVASIEDFSHLTRLDDGRAKAERARNAVRALRKLVAKHDAVYRDEREAEEGARRPMRGSCKSKRSRPNYRP